MTNLTLTAELTDDDVDRIAKATAARVDRATELLVDLIMAAREGNDHAFARAKEEATQLLGLEDVA